MAGVMQEVGLGRCRCGAPLVALEGEEVCATTGNVKGLCLLDWRREKEAIFGRFGGLSFPGNVEALHRVARARRAYAAALRGGQLEGK